MAACALLSARPESAALVSASWMTVVVDPLQRAEFPRIGDPRLCGQDCS